MIEAAAGFGVDEIVDHRPTPREIPRPVAARLRARSREDRRLNERGVREA
jgi:hypothetical protein